jgi:osmotically-inducible protein OsmY
MTASIEGTAESRLHESDQLELHGIRCTFRRGILTLYGMVSSFYARQVAQELIKDLEGIDIIDNQIEVNSQAIPAAS